jgi:lysophospholipase L1-like esterase
MVMDDDSLPSGLDSVKIDVLWDTSFTVESILFPTDSIMARSVIAAGDSFRLHRFLSKCRNENSVNIGFIGGSITIGALASSEDKRFSNIFCYMLNKIFPQLTINQVNAGISGTNSRFACSRAKDDFLPQDPDIIFIEFGVNDDHHDTVLTEGAIEGLVRQCLQQNDVPVLMFFTMDTFNSHINHDIHTKVGQHYNLPIISYYDACWPLVESGALSWNAVAADMVHPNDAGHLICGYLLFSFFKNYAYRMDTLSQGSGIPLPLSTDIYQFAGFHDTTDTLIKIISNTGFADTVKELGRIGYTSVTAGDSLVIESTSREMTMGFHYSKDHNARLLITVNGNTHGALSNYYAQDMGGGVMKLYQLYITQNKQVNRVVLENLDNDTFEIKYLLLAE